ncbi:ankyrin repeat-containing domain protein [Aspergillus undulatus]|uniref:ankyrin repeat-containing domain protein n=1 Tax=Aspergillus undulatus TaxID=1810928 RepID=UPI003CCD8EC2
MSFGFGVGDFLAVLKLADRARKQFVDAPGQLWAVSDDVKRLSNVLRDIEDNDPAESLSFEKQRILNEISQGCHDVLYDLINSLAKYEDMLNDDRSASLREAGRRVWKRLTFDQHEIDMFRRRIQTNVNTFNLFLQSINHQLSRETKDIVTATLDGVNELVQQQDGARRREILNWLAPATHESKQVDLFGRVQPGTGAWLLESDEYQRWIGQDEKTPQDQRTLFCPGLPGAGKTFLSSIVVNELQRSGNPLAFFYCNFREKTTLVEILAVLLRQLAQQHAVPPSALETIYEKHMEKGTTLTVDEGLAILDSLLAVSPKTFVVLDALDECQLPSGQRKKFLTELFSLQKTRSIGLFATSRDHPDVAGLFEGKRSLHIRASAGDVERFLNGELGRLPRVVQHREDLQREIITAITESIDGMFLLARLHIDSIQGKRSVKQIRESLKSLPSGLDAAYEDAWSRIESQLPDQVQTAKDALSWVSCAARPLTPLELQHALAIEDDLSFLDGDNLPEIEDLIVACGGLVTVDEQENVVRLVHYTTQEYFERHQDRLLPGARYEIGKNCTNYLCFDEFQSGTCWKFEDYDKRLRDFPLFEYVAEHWGHHVRQQEVELDRILGFLRKKGNVNACYQAIIPRAKWWYTADNWYALSREFQSEVRGVHLAACFGLVEACRVLIEEDEDGQVDSTTDLKQTPLWLAAQYGFPDLVQDLLGKGAFIESRETRKGCTPLYAAVQRGHEGVFHILANAGADIEARSELGNTPLGIAAELGLESMAKLLLERGVDPNAIIHDNVTALRRAAMGGHGAMFKLLLGAVGPEQARASRRELLNDAAIGGNGSIVQLLLKVDDFPPDEKAACAQYALRAAVTRAREETCRILLAVDGVNVEGKYEDDGIPLLSMALNASEKSTAIIKLLLEEYGANPNALDSKGRTPLSHAVCVDLWRCFNYEQAGEIVQLLLDIKAVDINSTCNEGRTPLHFAVGSCQRIRTKEARVVRETVVQILLENGARVDTRDNDGETPLSYAAKVHLPSIVKMLLDKGADINCKDKDGRTPMSHAVDPTFKQYEHPYCDVRERANPLTLGEYAPPFWEKRVKDMVQVLLDNGANPDLEDEEGLTPLSRAEARLPGHEVLPLLQEAATQPR